MNEGPISNLNRPRTRPLRAVKDVDSLPIDLRLNMQLLPASFTKYPNHIDVGLLPFFQIAKVSVGELVRFDDESHDLPCHRDHAGCGEEPQFSDKSVEVDKL